VIISNKLFGDRGWEKVHTRKKFDDIILFEKGWMGSFRTWKFYNFRFSARRLPLTLLKKGGTKRRWGVGKHLAQALLGSQKTRAKADAAVSSPYRSRRIGRLSVSPRGRITEGARLCPSGRRERAIRSLRGEITSKEKEMGEKPSLGGLSPTDGRPRRRQRRS